MLVWDYEKSPGEDSTPGALIQYCGLPWSPPHRSEISGHPAGRCYYRGKQFAVAYRAHPAKKMGTATVGPPLFRRQSAEFLADVYSPEEGRNPCLTSAALTCSTGETLVGAALVVTNAKKPRKTGGLARGFSVLMGGPVMAEGNAITCWNS